MISKLFPLTKNKLRILEFIYTKKETHLLEISKILKTHPYSVQKTLKSLNRFIITKKVGKTLSLSLDFNMSEIFDLLYLIETYTAETKEKIKILIKNLQTLFSKDKNVLCCVLFGSYAKESFTKESDIDLLFVVRRDKKETEKRCYQLESLLGREINQVIMDEKEFDIALKEKEPTLTSLLEPSQRIIILGKEYFLRRSFKI